MSNFNDNKNFFSKEKILKVSKQEAWLRMQALESSMQVCLKHILNADMVSILNK